MARLRTKLSSVIAKETALSRTIDAIIKAPRLPTEPIPGVFDNKSDEEIVAYYKKLGVKWKPEIAMKPLSLDKFAELTEDYLGDRSLNRDKVNRVKYTGMGDMGAKTINSEALQKLSYFSKAKSYKDLYKLAQEALSSESSGGSSELDTGAEGIKEKEEAEETPALSTSWCDVDNDQKQDNNNSNSTVYHDKTSQASNGSAQATLQKSTAVAEPTARYKIKMNHQTLAEYVAGYVDKNGFASLVEEGLSPEQILNLMAGKLPISNTIIILQDIFNLSSEEILEMIENTYLKNLKEKNIKN